MIINKILNNNVVVVKDKSGKEKIVMGKGIAFKKSVGETFDETKIDKVFTLTNIDISNRFQELIYDIPLKHIKLADQIISYAKLQLGKRLNDMIYISLTDHIHTSIVRFTNGITIKNALLYDIKRFYPDEFNIGVYALNVIEEILKIRLPEDEAGFMALHIVNADMDETGIQQMYTITRIMQQILDIVKYVFNVEFDENSVYYYRFITHLKFFAQRLINKKTYEDEESYDLLEVIRIKYKNSYDCACKISDFIKNKYNYDLSNDEKLYLTIHIEKVIYKTNK